jgi:hypothetical protein
MLPGIVRMRTRDWLITKTIQVNSFGQTTNGSTLNKMKVVLFNTGIFKLVSVVIKVQFLRKVIFVKYAGYKVHQRLWRMKR